MNDATSPDADAAVAMGAFAQSLADTARSIVQPLYRQGLDVEYKPDRSPVTAADREVERTLCARVAERYPEHGFIGEEFGPHQAQARFKWVVDPIDGTKSFVTGRPLFGTLIALLDDLSPIVGVIDMPMLDERWVGVRGTGSTLNGEPARTSDCERLAHARVSATTPDMFKDEDLLAFDRVSTAARMRTFGSDCYAYGLLASGFVDAVLEASLSPYDFLALVPVIEGAGGVMTDWEGQPLSVASDGRVVAAANARLHAEVLSLLNADH